MSGACVRGPQRRADRPKVLGATGRPGVTPPPTDVMGSGVVQSGDGWRPVLVGLAGILIAALLLIQPQRSPRRR
jgi:hypothetical protein